MAVALVPVASARVDPTHPPVDPHHIDGPSLGGPIDISSAWLLQQGDDPRWADPNFDDRHWLLFKTDGPPLSSYGLKNVDLVWYRTHVHIRPDMRNLALLLRSFTGSKAVFVNGIQVGVTGPFPPGGKFGRETQRIYLIPDSALGSGDLTVAIKASIGRYSRNGKYYGGLGPGSSMLLGTAPAMLNEASLYLFRDVTSNFTNLILRALLLLIAIALAVTLRGEAEYRALAVYLLANLILDVLGIWSATHNVAWTPIWYLLINIPRVMLFLAELEFVRLVLKVRRSRLLLVYEWMFLIVKYGGDCYTLIGTYYGITLSPVILNANVIVFTPLSLGLPAWALWVWWKRKNPDALLLFIPLFIQAAYTYVYYAKSWLFFFHLAQSAGTGQPPIESLYVQWYELTEFLFSVTLLIFLVLRTLRVAGARAKIETEIAAARTMQQVLLARASEPTPGFEVESVYHPAGEVGGDFFLVSPGPDGSLTAIVGDVSGKGLVAAMRVSMILGVLRREDSRDPRTILSRLNEALLAQGEMGFTTACCVRLERNGRYQIANAGHISPYINGSELIAPPALPLGLASSQSYELLYGLLLAGHKLVLMSDGVVEARSAKGELYGFERLSLLTMKPAREIADTAQNFGQEDDITVMTIACCVA